MKKAIVLTLFAVCTSIMAMAQKDGKTKFSAGPEIGIATGTFGLSWGLGIGVSAQAEHFFQENVSGTALLGLISYFGKSYAPGKKYTAYTTIPLRVGVRYYIGDGFHAGLQIGVGFLSYGGSSTTAFAYSPQLGYNFKTNKNKAIDLTLKYDAYTKNGTIGAIDLRVAYVF